MAQEIERKFLVSGDFCTLSHKSVRIVQGYLSSVPQRTVRIRISGDSGYITIKGAAASGSIGRFEWEKEISLADAEQLLQLCEPGVVDKIRYFVKVGKHTYEIDVFEGENKGLIVAEIELSSEDEAFEKPSWLGTEVTGDPRYYNSMLSRKPYRKW